MHLNNELYAYYVVLFHVRNKDNNNNNKTMHYKYLTHHVWHTIRLPGFELYSCSENPVETLILLYQLSDL